MEKNTEKNVYVCIYGCTYMYYTPETNTTLQINYTSIKK